MNKKSEFGKKLKTTTGTSLIAAFGFLIALAWRDLILEYANNLTKISPIQGKFIIAILVTIASVIGIMIVSKIAKIER